MARRHLSGGLQSSPMRRKVIPSITPFGGLAPVSDTDDLTIRMSLRMPELGMAADLASFRQRLRFDAHELDEIATASRSPIAESCLLRFAKFEADLSIGERRGLGRYTAKAFPRLGGALHSDLGDSPAAAWLIRSGVERTIHAGYLWALTHEALRARERSIEDFQELWDKWIPNAYEVESDTQEFVYEVCAVYPFWQAVLEQVGLPKEAKIVSRQVNWKSPVLNSLCGLAMAGFTLAHVERHLPL
jgi:hypothetical protein